MCMNTCTIMCMCIRMYGNIMQPLYDVLYKHPYGACNGNIKLFPLILCHSLFFSPSLSPSHVTPSGGGWTHSWLQPPPINIRFVCPSIVSSSVGILAQCYLFSLLVFQFYGHCLFGSSDQVNLQLSSDVLLPDRLS